jgi:hypothetical protein
MKKTFPTKIGAQISYRPGKLQSSTSLKFSLATEHPVPSDGISIIMRYIIILCFASDFNHYSDRDDCIFCDFQLQTVLRKRRRAGQGRNHSSQVGGPH